mgnify:CR=1 FL=1
MPQEFPVLTSACASACARSPPRESGTCYYFRTVTHPEFSLYRELFYSSNRKIVPLALLDEQFSELSLAVWLMDDGGVDRKQVRLNTQSFSLAENEALSSFYELNLELIHVSIEIKIVVVCALLTPAFND